jgi:Flp pilus assembly protein TadG
MSSRIHRISRNGQPGGFSSLYLLLIMPVLLGFASLGLDLGRVQLTKAKLQYAADSAARAAASAIPNDPQAAVALAVKYAGMHSVNGTPIQMLEQDVEFGIWDIKLRTFTKLSGFGVYGANAVRVSISRVAAKGNATKMQLASLVGMSSVDVKVSAIAMVSGGATVTINVPGTSDPYLAGMPPGSKASYDDVAPDQCPTQVTAIAVTPGAELTFSFTGAVRNNPSLKNFQPDGNLGWILHHDAGAENGIADVMMPINAQLGVFLTDEQPNLTAAPEALDFSSEASRDFTVLKPKLKQPFFIGDGVNSSGTVQRFVVPAGATRFYLGTMDGYEWMNNKGSFTTTVTLPRMIQIVK